MGASSGIGYAVAKRLIEEGWMVGLSARRLEPLETLTQLAPERVFTQRIDVTNTEATTPLSQLVARLGGIDLYFHASGIGKQNTLLDESIEQATLATNVMGFARMVDFVFNYMADNGGGHIAIISSVAGTKGIGSAASYSASKTFQNAYIQALDQLAVKRGLPIIFTDIRLCRHPHPYGRQLPDADDGRTCCRAYYVGIKTQKTCANYRLALSTDGSYLAHDTQLCLAQNEDWQSLMRQSIASKVQ